MKSEIESKDVNQASPIKSLKFKEELQEFEEELFDAHQYFLETFDGSHDVRWVLFSWFSAYIKSPEYTKLHEVGKELATIRFCSILQFFYTLEGWLDPGTEDPA